MTPELWRKVEELFHQALAQPLESRCDWLTQACGDDTQLLREVESMLEADSARSPGLERQIRSTAAALLLEVFGHKMK